MRDGGFATPWRTPQNEGSQSIRFDESTQRRSRTQVLEDVPGAQNVLIPAITGYTGSAWGSVKLEFLDVYPGTKSEELAVAELGLKATNMEGL